MSATDELLLSLFAGQHPEFQTRFAGWLRGSRRLHEFAHTYRNKIRSKLSNAKHPGRVQDVYAELETAAHLHSELRFVVEYEHFATRKQRGPDFTVMFKGHTPFHVEVRRLNPNPARLAQVVSEKCRQLPSGAINLLWLALEDELAHTELDEAMRSLRLAAERKDAASLQASGVDDAA